MFRTAVQDTTWEPCCVLQYRILGSNNTEQSRAESTTCNSISISPKSSKGHFGLAIRRPCLWPKAPLPLLAVQNNYNSLVNRTVRTLSLSLFLKKAKTRQATRCRWEVLFYELPEMGCCKQFS